MNIPISKRALTARVNWNWLDAEIDGRDFGEPDIISSWLASPAIDHPAMNWWPCIDLDFASGESEVCVNGFGFDADQHLPYPTPADYEPEVVGPADCMFNPSLTARNPVTSEVWA